MEELPIYREEVWPQDPEMILIPTFQATLKVGHV